MHLRLSVPTHRRNYLVIFSIIIAIFVIVAYVLWLQNKIAPSVGRKNIISVQVREHPLQSVVTAFYSFDLISKQSKEILNIPENTPIHEASVSPDGQKLYYISSSTRDGLPISFPNAVTIVTSDGSKQEFKFAKDALWTLSSPGILIGGLDRDCFWSPNSSKLACILIQRESSTGAGIGLTNIMLLDYSTKEISEVFNSDNLFAQKHELLYTKFAGWVGNEKLLVVTIDQTANIINGDIQPADFYTVDIKTQSVDKQFSYRYSGSPIAVSREGERILLESTSRLLGNTRLVEFDLLSKKNTVFNASKDIYVANIAVSEDGSKMVYSASTGGEINIYDLSTREEKTIKVPTSIYAVQALLHDNKTFIFSKNREKNSSLFDNQTQQIVDLKGFYIGFGDF